MEALSQPLNLDTNFISCPLFKLVSWASVFPRPCTLLIYLRETLIVFSLQYLVFFICDLRNVKRKYTDTHPGPRGRGLSGAPSESPPVLDCGGLPPPPRRGLNMLPRRQWGRWGRSA